MPPRSDAATTPHQSPAAPPSVAPAPRMPGQKKEWEREIDERRVAISVRLPESLKARLDGLTDHLALSADDGLTDLVTGLTTQTDVFNLALHRFLATAEQQLNGGAPLPVRIRRR